MWSDWDFNDEEKNRTVGSRTLGIHEYRNGESSSGAVGTGKGHRVLCKGALASSCLPGTRAHCATIPFFKRPVVM